MTTAEVEQPEVVYQDAPLVPSPPREDKPEKRRRWFKRELPDPGGPEVVIIERDRLGVLPAVGPNGVPDLRMASDGTYVNPRIRPYEEMRAAAEQPMDDRSATLEQQHRNQNHTLRDLREGTIDSPGPMEYLALAEEDPDSEAYTLLRKHERSKHWKQEYDFWESIKHDRVVLLALRVIDTRERIAKSPRYVALRARMGRGSK